MKTTSAQGQARPASRLRPNALACPCVARLRGRVSVRVRRQICSVLGIRRALVRTVALAVQLTPARFRAQAPSCRTEFSGHLSDARFVDLLPADSPRRMPPLPANRRAAAQSTLASDASWGPRWRRLGQKRRLWAPWQWPPPAPPWGYRLLERPLFATRFWPHPPPCTSGPFTPSVPPFAPGGSPPRWS